MVERRNEMQRTYKFPIKYLVTRCRYGEFRMCNDAIKEPYFRKIRDDFTFQKGHDPFPKAIEKLQKKVDELFDPKDMSSKEKEKFFENCFNINGIKKVRLKYNLSPFKATLSITVNRELSDIEKKDLNDGIEGQMIDGYGENPKKLFDFNGYSYYIEI